MDGWNGAVRCVEMIDRYIDSDAWCERSIDW
jgi:hypothetical protein